MPHLSRDLDNPLILCARPRLPGLQSFRKEAIWRQMQDYKRRYERAQRDVDDLAQTRRACESRLSAVEMSWKLVSIAGWHVAIVKLIARLTARGRSGLAAAFDVDSWQRTFERRSVWPSVQSTPVLTCYDSHLTRRLRPEPERRRPATSARSAERRDQSALESLACSAPCRIRLVVRKIRRARRQVSPSAATGA